MAEGCVVSLDVAKYVLRLGFVMLWSPNHPNRSSQNQIATSTLQHPTPNWVVFGMESEKGVYVSNQFSQLEAKARVPKERRMKSTNKNRGAKGRKKGGMRGATCPEPASHGQHTEQQ